ncbi:hypothetical protein ACUHGC_06290 [Testudinibacter sp. P27/CKL/0425]
MSNPFSARWTAVGNTLCLGHWEISYQGLPLVLPEQKREHDMGTNGIYSFMDPEEELFREGLYEDDWIIENADWLADVFIASNVPLDEAHFHYFYQAVNQEDWRCGSCGGCM